MMAREEQHPKADKREERFVSATEWTVCSLMALFCAFGSVRNHPGAGPAYLLGTFIGPLVAILLFWIAVREICRWIIRKRLRA
jgi:hypothetical protein